MSISHNEEAKAADDLFFGLELQGTDGKAATLIYLNGSPEPHLSFGFSSDFFFFFQWLCLAESPWSLFKNLFFNFSTVLFHFQSYHLCCYVWLQVSASKKHGQSLVGFAKGLLYTKILEGLKGIGRNVPSQLLLQRPWILGRKGEFGEPAERTQLTCCS